MLLTSRAFCILSYLRPLLNHDEVFYRSMLELLPRILAGGFPATCRTAQSQLDSARLRVNNDPNVCYGNFFENAGKNGKKNFCASAARA